MTIEAKIDETNALLKQLIAALGGKAPTAADRANAKIAAEKKDAGKTEAQTPAPTEAPKLTYDTVSKKILAVVAAKGRDTAVACLKKFSDKPEPKGTDVKPESWPALMVELDKALASETALV